MATATLRLWLSFVLAVTVVSACGGGDDDASSCDDGDTRACECPGGGEGMQTCVGGAFGTCTDCVGGVDGGGVDSGATPDAPGPSNEVCDGRDNDQDGATDEWETPGNEDCMIGIPGGAFTMGCDPGDESDCPADAQPPHTVTLSAFLIDRTEVTQAAYKACMDAGVCLPPTGIAEDFDPVAMADRPVVWVNWQRSLAYCSWVAKRLPTEAEWERAARGTDGRRYPWGGDTPSCELAIYDACGAGGTHVVGSVTSGDAGGDVHDLAGNVAEWVIDRYDPAYYASATEWDNPVGPTTGTQRVQRGGRWDADVAQLPGWARVAAAPGAASAALGFRCAETQP